MPRPWSQARRGWPCPLALRPGCHTTVPSLPRWPTWAYPGAVAGFRQGPSQGASSHADWHVGSGGSMGDLGLGLCSREAAPPVGHGAPGRPPLCLGSTGGGVPATRGCTSTGCVQAATPPLVASCHTQQLPVEARDRLEPLLGEGALVPTPLIHGVGTAAPGSVSARSPRAASPARSALAPRTQPDRAGQRSQAAPHPLSGPFQCPSLC